MPLDTPEDRIEPRGEADPEARGAEGSEVNLSSNNKHNFHVDTKVPPPPLEYLSLALDRHFVHHLLYLFHFISF